MLGHVHGKREFGDRRTGINCLSHVIDGLKVMGQQAEISPASKWREPGPVLLAAGEHGIALSLEAGDI
ncbi:MAG: hypothetical protein EBY49_04225, partial [Actinobacteria bacterium]|nr:hypothetical protein [Actinomycetota bacterium]